MLEIWTVPLALRLMGAALPNRQGLILCPVHAENNPSCHIVKDQRGWICFSCGAKGGVLDLIVAYNFAGNRAEAAEWLESMANGRREM